MNALLRALASRLLALPLAVLGAMGLAPRRRARAQLLALQRRRDALINAIPDFVWMKDLEGRYVVVNEAFACALGRPAPEVEGCTLADVLPPELAERFARQDAAVIASGQPFASDEAATLLDGVERFYETIKVPLRDERGDIVGTVGRSRDVTERHRLEAQLRQAQKMEALGLLAGSVAHDFNNLLTVILGGVDLVAEALDADSEAAADLGEVRRAAQCATGLTRQLLTFSRHDVRQPQLLDLVQVVRESEALLQRLVPDGVVLDFALGAEPCAVRADPCHLEQILMNLVVNARDAVLAVVGRGTDATHNGVIIVAVGPRSFAAEDPRLARPDAQPLPPGRYAALLVRDTGIGMDAETRARIFDPFFTTKEAGKGTGLGLATVMGIVTQSGGTVHVETAPGLGATFTVVLPLADAAEDRAPHAASVDECRPGTT